MQYEYLHWKLRLNNILVNNTSLNLDCFQDLDYYSYFDNDYSPAEVAKIVVEKEWGSDVPELKDIEEEKNDG